MSVDLTGQKKILHVGQMVLFSFAKESTFETLEHEAKVCPALS